MLALNVKKEETLIVKFDGKEIKIRFNKILPNSVKMTFEGDKEVKIERKIDTDREEK